MAFIDLEKANDMGGRGNNMMGFGKGTSVR